MDEIIKALTEMIKMGGTYAIWGLSVYIIGNIIQATIWVICFVKIVGLICECTKKCKEIAMK